jgi:hypothetical protein
MNVCALNIFIADPMLINIFTEVPEPLADLREKVSLKNSNQYKWNGMVVVDRVLVQFR